LTWFTNIWMLFHLFIYLILILLQNFVYFFFIYVLDTNTSIFDFKSQFLFLVIVFYVYNNRSIIHLADRILNKVNCNLLHSLLISHYLKRAFLAILVYLCAH
jgi:hypothetical protein